MNAEGKELLMTKQDGHQRKQRMKNDYELSRDVGEQAQVIIKNVLAAETHLAVEKFPNAGAKGTDLSARPAGSVNADEAADAADRTMADAQHIQSSCDLKVKGKEKIAKKVRLQGKGR
jgi:hypothetical protein